MSCELVADDVFVIGGTHVNMYLLRDGRDLTLIDAGWYGDAATIEKAIRGIGHRPEDIAAILLTHAHLDHVGAMNHLHSHYGIPAYTSAIEVAHARGECHESATPLDVIKRLTDRDTIAWAARITAAGGLRKNIVPHIQPFPTEGPLDLPGHPVPLPCPGHTSGHSAFHLPEAGAIATGDALVTAHPTSKIQGPQPLPNFFNHDTPATLAGYTTLESVPADNVLPGHGPVWRDGIAAAVALARENARHQRD
ncbi:MBL fold metallo-hydrolase [Nocardia neocaledoniensis NBRC 108232]|uniref:Glyoxylase-like metal-dependent hydrolase (Beta-lactamase superfamily II) n=1 Tax=Nocardia neocaledoniensis TaxID=236511 RepID=A0A317NLF2_9NOCA|nr:MBL fold metallo-hydrolase [Nocardia neocaledoniensis]PWV76281.1 glyoxylase-like metal-dependent hydrolase (beta-lactamase superfamily II) [Nocardia neocaledoniensis]GEM32223.1 MBL fold metallo-hydrolase [Nocardia neocaledoniensis NBRC 108232]